MGLYTGYVNRMSVPKLFWKGPPPASVFLRYIIMHSKTVDLIFLLALSRLAGAFLLIFIYQLYQITT